MIDNNKLFFKELKLEQRVLYSGVKEDPRTTFRKRLESTIIPENATNKEQLYQGLNEVANKIMPSTLFRYRTCSEYNVNAFRDNSIYCVNPSKFNDIHDSVPYCNQDRIIALLQKSLGIDASLRLWEYYSEKKKLPQINGDLSESLKEELFKLLSLPYREFRARLNPIIFTDFDIDLLKDEMNGAISQMRELSRIACFCEDFDSLLMWAHYAEEHNGFVLEYNKEEIIKAVNKNTTTRIFPVIYSDTRYNAENHLLYELQNLLSKKITGLPEMPMPDGCILEKIYLYKAEEWRYEKEWRLFYAPRTYIDNSADHFYELRDIKPKAIYYGIRMDSVNRSLLSNFAKTHKIEEYEMQVDDSSLNFKLIKKRV